MTSKITKAAESIQKHHDRIVQLRQQIVLPALRKALKEATLDQIDGIENPQDRQDLEWAWYKVLRGYFGTDVKSNQLLHFVKLVDMYLS